MTKKETMKPVQSIFVFLLLVGLTFETQAADPTIDVSVQLSSTNLHIGDFVKAEVTIAIPRGFVLYGPTPLTDGPLPLTITSSGDALAPHGYWHGKAPRRKYDDAFETTLEYYIGEATLSTNLKAVASSNELILLVTGQLCNDISCFDQEQTVAVPVSITAGTAKRTTPYALTGETYSPNRTITAVVPNGADASPQMTSTASLPVNEPATEYDKMPLLAFVLIAMVYGLGALLTPCVFPMIPITISFFSKFREVSWRRNLIMASVYGVTIVLVYSIPGVLLTMFFGENAMQSIATHPAFDIFLAALLIFFGLNLLGLFELRLPSGLINKSANAEKKMLRNKDTLTTQIASVFFMAITFTLVSFSCTVAFVGGLLPMASRGEAFYPLIGMLAFSTSFAFPFVLLAIFPAVAQKLQGKAGDWMLAVKIFFGAVELAAALKFLSNLDLHFNWGLLTRNVVLYIWVFIFAATALYVLKIFEFKKASGIPGPIRIGIAIVLIVFTARSFWGIQTHSPMGGLVDGWLPPINYPVDNDSDQSGSFHAGSFIIDNMPRAVFLAQAENKPLFVDFTGIRCANCRMMESRYFTQPQVLAQFDQMILLKAYTDGAKNVHRTQRAYQIDRFRTAALPMYAIIDPHSDTVLAQFSGMTDSQQEFVSFLKKGLEKWHQKPL